MVEDNVHDAELIAAELKASGFDLALTRVQSEAQFRQALAAALPDVILSDHGLPAFSGFKALEIVRDTYPTLPFIFVSGLNEQQMIVEMYEAGATDYVFKRDLFDLAPAVRTALKPAPEPPVETPRAAPPAPPNPVEFTRLRLCPVCLQARDEQNVTVDFLTYFRTHSEIVVLHELCNTCQPTARLN